MIRSVSLKELNSGKIHKEGHHLKDRHYTTNTQNTHDFYKEKRKGLDEHKGNLESREAKQENTTTLTSLK